MVRLRHESPADYLERCRHDYLADRELLDVYHWLYKTHWVGCLTREIEGSCRICTDFETVCATLRDAATASKTTYLNARMGRYE